MKVRAAVANGVDACRHVTRTNWRLHTIRTMVVKVIALVCVALLVSGCAAEHKFVALHLTDGTCCFMVDGAANGMGTEMA